MKFNPALQEAVLLKRYKRFLADFQLVDGTELTLHCPNTGSMLNCAEPGNRVWYSTTQSKTRKYPNTWELVEVGSGQLVSINTGRANALVKEAITAGTIDELRGYSNLNAEVRYGDEKSRVDFVLDDRRDRPDERCFVEVKSVTLGMGQGLGLFPDSVSLRGQKHLRELMAMRALGHRAVLLFCVQHSGIDRVEPADHIDSVYGQLLRQAADAGVEVLAYGAEISPVGISLRRPLAVVMT